MDAFHPLPRKEYLDRQKGLGRGLFGVFPGRYPREIFWALNALPVEIWDPLADLAGAGAHLQPAVCSVVKSGLDLVLRGGCAMLDGFLFPHTCDSLQNLGSLVRDCVGVEKPCLDFYVPKATGNEGAQLFFRGEVERLIRSLEPLCGTLDPDALGRAVNLGRDLARALEKLYTLRAEGRLEASNVEFYRLVRSVEFMHPDDSIPALRAFAKERERPEPSTSPSILLSGVLPNPRGLLSLLDNLGIRVGDDDLLACGRRLPGVCNPEGEPMEALAESYFGMPSCSTINAPLGERKARLLERVLQSRSQGVLFHIVKFCEPELFAFPGLRESLRSRGIRTLFAEHDVNREISGQVATRLEAFAEMIGQEEGPGVDAPSDTRGGTL